ncbi:MFS transporter [Lichenicoccus sp.]|uniref:MFS transporter n=1 Tax=Lichenicoccus sp. TaxID=2781899 RepID=UPI003D0C5B15
MTDASSGALRSLRNYNFRLWSAGSLTSNVGAWMQRTAQDWLVLTELTRHDASAVGLVVACQFGPQVLLLPWTGSAADYIDRRKLLLATQAAMGLLALGLAILTIGGWVRTWHVYVFALLLGCASAFDAPARQTFVADLVGDDDLANAVAINSTSANLARLVGPAIAGLLIAGIGSGWVFAINAASFVAVLLSLALMRTRDLVARDRPERKSGSFVEGLRYVRGRRDLIVLLAMLLVFGALGMNFPIFISTMAASTFHLQARGFGLLTSAMAIGSIAGALLAARRRRPTTALIIGGALVFGCAYATGAVLPTPLLFGAALAVVGAASQTVTTSTTSLVQLSTEPQMRGRVMALLLTIVLGGQPVGAPLVGWIANQFGPRWGVAVGAAAGFITAAIGCAYLALRRRDRPDETISSEDAPVGTDQV